MARPAPPRIFVVSDGRGETCRQVMEAALVQFPDRSSETVLHADVRTPERVEELRRTVYGDR